MTEAVGLKTLVCAFGFASERPGFIDNRGSIVANGSDPFVPAPEAS